MVVSVFLDSRPFPVLAVLVVSDPEQVLNDAVHAVESGDDKGRLTETLEDAGRRKHG